MNVCIGKKQTFFSGRRRFDEDEAAVEVNYTKSHGGLNTADRGLLQEIYYESSSVIEWGVGESTLIDEFTRVPRYVGVDSSRDWLKQASLTAPTKYKFVWVNIGPIGPWGVPLDHNWKQHWPQYSHSPLASEPEAFDFYFVDGRFRVASVCAAFLHASLSQRSTSSFRVGLHDFQERHKSQTFGAVLSFAEIVDGYNPMRHDDTRQYRVVILRRKVTATTGEILRLWKKYSKVRF